MTLVEKQYEFVEMFNSLPSWTDKFQYLIDLGSEMPSLPDNMRTPGALIPWCTSRTFFHATAHNNVVSIQGWSNAAIPSGLIALIRAVFDGCNLDDLQTETINFHIKTDLINNLTEQRKAGLLEMINHLKRL